jgi:SAM-dependent methyltransferase
VTAFPDESFELLEQIEDSSFWFRARNDLIASMIQRHFPDARSFLDVGCGSGYVLASLHERFPELRLVGIEPSEDGLAVARRRLAVGVELEQGDARSIGRDGQFDVVGSFDVLEHVDDDELALRQIATATRGGGGVILTVPQHPFLWSTVDEFSHHQRRYTRRDLLAKLQRAGLDVMHVTSFVTLLLPVVALSRLRNNRADAATYDPKTEYRLPRAVDRVFEAVMTSERALIRLGVSLPVGSSLLVVARRV